MKNFLLSRYGVAALAVGLALPLQRLLLVPLFGVEPNTSPFMAFFAAVTVAAWFGGLWPGLFATALSALLSWYFFLPPQHSFEIASLGQSLSAIVFVSEGALISSVVEALHTARRRAEASVSEARRGQEDLRRNEERFRALVQNSSDIITVIDAEGTVRYVSPAVERITGHRPEELVGKSVYHYVRPDDLEEAQGVFAELLSRPGVHPPFEFEVPHKNGSRRRFEFFANNLLDDSSVSGVVVNQRDITERTESEKRLREAETRFRTLVEQIPAVTYIEAIDRVGRATDLLYVSPQVEDLLGYPPEVWAADPQLFAKLLHPEDRERVLAEDRRTEETGEPFEVEYRQIARDGRVVWVRDEAVLIRDDEGMPLFWQGIQLDITGRKEAEKQLRESEELYRTVVEQAAEKIFIVDTEDKRILEANAAFYASLGYAPKELEGTTLYDLVAADPRSINANIQRIVEGHTFTGERRYRRKDGSLMDVEVSASLLYYGGKQAMCIVSHDVTERNRAEENLRRSLDALLALYEAGQVLGSSLKREEIGLRLLGIVERIS